MKSIPEVFEKLKKDVHEYIVGDQFDEMLAERLVDQAQKEVMSAFSQNLNQKHLSS